MSPRGRDHRPSPLFFGAAGWLFADLLLALSMVFLVANSVGSVKVTPTPPPTATLAPTIPIPTATPVVLSLQPITITVTVSDYGLLLQGNASMYQSVQQQVINSRKLDGKRAGLVLAFGGTTNDAPGTGTAIANAANAALQALGNSSTPYAFKGTVFRGFLDLSEPLGTINFDVYVFK